MTDEVTLREAGSVANAVTFWLPNLPPSINEVYAPGHSIYSAKPVWDIKPEWLIWRTNNGPYIPAWSITAGSLIRCDLLFFYDYFYPKQRSRLRIVDTQNMCKFTIDTIAKKIGFNDLLVKSGSWNSEHLEGGGKVRVTLMEIRR